MTASSAQYQVPPLGRAAALHEYARGQALAGAHPAGGQDRLGSGVRSLVEPAEIANMALTEALSFKSYGVRRST
jgi:hypothetical protein